MMTAAHLALRAIPAFAFRTRRIPAAVTPLCDRPKWASCKQHPAAQQDLAQMTRTIRTMVLRYAMARLQELKQQAQQRNLFFLGSDVKQELNNIIDNFTTNFMDITYNEVVSFLEIVRPGGERLVDQLMVSEELSGRDLRALAREYVSKLGSLEVLYSTRQSSLFDLMSAELKKSVIEVENDVDQLNDQLITK